MLRLITPVLALLLSAGILILGNGLLGTLLPVRAELEHFSTVAIGLLGSSYFLGFGAGCLVAPFVIKRVGHIRTFAALAALAAVSPLVHAILPAPLPWAALRVVTGFCFAGLYTVIESWLNEKSDNRNRGTILSVYVIVNLGAITTGQLLLSLEDPASFELFSLVAILTALALLPVALSTASAPAPLAFVRLRLWRLYAVSPVGFVGCFMIGMTNGAFWTLAPAYATSLGQGHSMVGVFMATAVLGGALAQWPLGRLSDRLDRRSVLILGCSGAAAGAFGLLLQPAMPFWLFGSGLLFGAMGLSLYAICIAHANDFISSSDAVEASSGLLLTYALGAILGPTVASSAMALWRPGALFAFTAIIHLSFALFTAYRMSRRAALPAAERENFVLMEPRSTPAIFELDPRAEPTQPAAGQTPSQDGS